MPLSALPVELIPFVKQAILLSDWDALDPSRRREMAAQTDYQCDPKCEPILYFELAQFADDLKEWIASARSGSEHAVALKLGDVALRIESIVSTDRERVGLEIQALRDVKAKQATENAGPSALRWGQHNTKLLCDLAEAAQRWWGNYDPTDNTTAPTNQQVSEWLQARGVGKAMAEKMATILRADALPPGPRT